MDPTNIGYLGMKGLIDLRVADTLAKQTAMQHESALQQAKLAQYNADEAAMYTARADAMQAGTLTRDKDGFYPLLPPNAPHQAAWYQPRGISLLQKGSHHSSRVFLSSAECAVAVSILDPSTLRRRLSEFI